MVSPLRVGIVGAGGIAHGVHAKRYVDHPHTELVAVMSRTKDKARAFAADFDVEHAYDSLEEMFKQHDLDAVSICTPNKFHYEGTIAALKAGCHVLCEKPPAMTEDEAKQMAEVANRTGRILMYGFHFRHDLEATVLKKFVDAGELGNVYHVNVQAMRRRGIPGWGVFTNRELQGGGPLIDVGVHMLDLAMYLTGFQEPETVLAQTHQRIGTRPGVGLLGEWDADNYSIEDLASGMIRFQNGMSLVLETSYAANVAKDEYLNVSLMGDKAGADSYPLRIYEEKHGALFDKQPAYLHDLDDRTSHERQMDHFIECCLGQSSPITTAEQGVVIQRLLGALYESARTGEAVKCHK
ncbi:Gfo/Idh/MocA family oxidoreductase [Texcoconibacillus texcoconensis]|uniref:Putative dehydrogenase n=1 Tax=Texcoconibacillus texcoconensis TaxID=1095777 RepID=A0A840QS15_9BACI|nr:putative dehydrogenase [Texcoconibacillus texcoconensis]